MLNLFEFFKILIFSLHYFDHLDSLRGEASEDGLVNLLACSGLETTWSVSILTQQSKVSERKEFENFEEIVGNPRHPSVGGLIKPIFEDNLTCGPRIEPVFRPKGMALGACRSGDRRRDETAWFCQKFEYHLS